MDPVSQLNTLIGEDTIRQMVRFFYERIRNDDLIGPMYPDSDWAGAEKRLADFLVYRFGGPQTYIQERGHPRLRARHFPFPIGVAERDRWMELMEQAILEAAVPVAARPVLTAFFSQVADSMRNQPE